MAGEFSLLPISDFPTSARKRGGIGSKGSGKERKRFRDREGREVKWETKM
jgi:hypothetical protein